MSEQEDRTRAIVREEIKLAMKTLGKVALSNARNASDDRDGERDGAFAIDSAASVFFESAYEADCAVADEARAIDAMDPFKESEAAGVDTAVGDLVHAEVQGALREMRDRFYLSGSEADNRIADRLDDLIDARQQDSNRRPGT